MVTLEELNRLNAEQMAALLGIKQRQLRNLVSLGLPSHGLGRMRRFEGSACVEWFVKRKVEELTPQASKGENEEWARTLTEQQTRKTKADAERAEIKLARERGEVVAVEDVKRMQFKVNAIIRNRLLGMPTKIAPLVATNGNVAKVKAILESEIREILTNLSKAGDEL